MFTDEPDELVTSVWITGVDISKCRSGVRNTVGGRERTSAIKALPSMSGLSRIKRHTCQRQRDERSKETRGASEPMRLARMLMHALLPHCSA
jgi:hypothetical protein